MEEGSQLEIDFAKLSKIGMNGHMVIPVVVQDATSKEVLIVAYANDKAVAETFRLGEAVLYSTSRNELWHKGATSGDVLKVEEVRINCEQNSLLYLVTPKGQGACHTKDETGKSRSSCYYRTVENNTRLRYS
ncbi:MAG: phosphoribosyl-AMP cyclohydrolase [Acidimicrobiaceae bacterium TMED130]|nr:MAG: phosphoribosyl-AMP cyclohydrolase [Acidimicrobiaceae bacterium TMED130]